MENQKIEMLRDNYSILSWTDNSNNKLSIHGTLLLILNYAIRLGIMQVEHIEITELPKAV